MVEASALGVPATSTLITTEWDGLCHDITLTVPDTATNFMDYYVSDEELDSDFLMAPVNEADYDSETQFCVDLKDPTGPNSFHDHFVTKRKKKGVAKKDAKPVKEQGTQDNLLKPPKSVPKRQTASGGLDLLAAPRGATLGNPKLGFSNTATRRLACGRMPPRQEVLDSLGEDSGNGVGLGMGVGDFGSTGHTADSASSEPPEGESG